MRERSNLKNDPTLKSLFALQRKLMARYVNMRYLPSMEVDLSTKEGVAVIRDVSLRLEEELHEFLRELKNRPYRKKVVNNFDMENLKKEYADIFHFVLELGILCGFHPDDVFSKFVEVNRQNHIRLDDGY